MRESLFNLLAHAHGDPVTDARVLDVFAGTGALGLEALSRGAVQATFVENGRKSLALLRENIRLLDAPGRIVARDARRPGPGTPHDLVFLDPPYGKALGEAALPALAEAGWLAPGALVVWEEAKPPALPARFEPIETRRWGDTTVALARYDP